MEAKLEIKIPKNIQTNNYIKLQEEDLWDFYSIKPYEEYIIITLNKIC